MAIAGFRERRDVAAHGKERRCVFDLAQQRGVFDFAKSDIFHAELGRGGNLVCRFLAAHHIHRAAATA